MTENITNIRDLDSSLGHRASYRISGDNIMLGDGMNDDVDATRRTNDQEKNTVCKHEISCTNSDSRFSCNICFDEVAEPVVTRCGHLYCWPCLFQWLEPGMRRHERKSLGMSIPAYRIEDNSRRLCPVCKLECPVVSVVPVYVRSLAPEEMPSHSLKETAKESSTNETERIPESEQQDHETSDDLSEQNIVDSNGIYHEGIRRRRAHRSSPQDDIRNTTEVRVPSRPLVNHPQEQQPADPSSPSQNSAGSSPPASSASYRTGGIQITPRSPNGHNASMTQGILLSLQRATADYYRNNVDTDRQSRRTIPSLHAQRNPLLSGTNDGSNVNSIFGELGTNHSRSYSEDSNGNLMEDDNHETTQYLSRLLLMLTSFVVFCLLSV